MRKLLLLPVLLVLAFAPAADAAKKKKAHKVTLNVTTVAHSIAAASATSGTDAGSATDPVLGAGAVVYTGNGTGTMQTVVFQAWFNLGSFKGTATVTLGSPDANGQVPFAGSGKVTSGTGKYKGAKGTLAFTGSIDAGTKAKPGTGNITFTATGNLTYTG